MRTGLALLAGFAAALASGCSGNKSASQAPAPAATAKATEIALTRFVTLPSRVAADPSAAPADPGVVTMSEGGDDEPPEGPTSFDLLSDGGFVVSDPLRQRLVFYDATGRFRSELIISFGAERVRVLSGNSLSVVRYESGDRYIFDADATGRYSPARVATDRDPDPDAADSGVSQLSSGNQAIVSAAPAPNTEVVPISVRYQAVGETMVSVRRLGLDRQRTFVAIEAAFPGERVDVRTLIRKYAPNSESLVEINDVPTTYYVHPVDEFRVRDGLVYQLMPRATDVRINIWDTSSRP